MRNDFIVFGLIAIIALCFGAAFVLYWLPDKEKLKRNELIAQSVANGANPLEAACAMGNEKACMVLLGKKIVDETMSEIKEQK